MDACLFCRIVAGEIPATVVYESDQLLAFRDINPKAPVHVLVVTKAHHDDVAALAEADPELAVALLAGTTAAARAEGIADGGYRVIFNVGPDSGQEVAHVHAHVLGGSRMGPKLAA